MNIKRFIKPTSDGKQWVIVCCNCKRAKDIDDNWHQISFDASVEITHTYCPECLAKAFTELK